MTHFSPKGQARGIAARWFHPGAGWIAELTNDIEEEIRGALETQLEVHVAAILRWGKDRVQSDRHTAEKIAKMLRELA